MRKLNIYILHCKALKERDASISNIVAKIKSSSYSNVEIGQIFLIASNDPSDINVELIQKTIDYSTVKEQNLALYNQFIKNIHVNQLSNTLKHVDALRKIIETPNTDLHLVIEDDMLFGDDLCSVLDSVLTKIKAQPIVFLGLPSNESGDIEIKETKTQFNIIPLVDSYIINYDTAKLISDNVFPIKFTTVFQLNYTLQKCGIQSYQSSRNVFVNGSKYGMFVSSLNPNNSLVFNKDYVTLLEIVNRATNTADDSIVVAKMQRESPIAKSPDFMYLIAKFHIKEKNYKEAEQILSEAYNITLANNGIVNHESVMLKDFITLFKHLQSF